MNPSDPIRYTWGAQAVDGGVLFRIWAPDHGEMALHLDGRDFPMQPRPGNWFETVAKAKPGAGYGFRLPGGTIVPDPAARAQIGDVHGLSRIIETDYNWVHERTELPWHRAVIYECHIGTFTPEGTCRAAMDRLSGLAKMGITVLELLPFAQFGGDRGWGYDGVLPYAPHPAYGTPDDLRALVDAAHGHGIAILMDVVYNHFGPDGNYLHSYASAFFDAGRQTPWGAGIDYSVAPVRRFFIENALYWLKEFRIDGLRLDAIDQIRDPTMLDILVETAREIRGRFPTALLTTEDNRNITRLHKPDETGRLMDGEWNDDWHNAAHVLLTGETEGYYARYADGPTPLLTKAMAEGFATEGADGSGVNSADQTPVTFIDFLQNHDQIGNRAKGERLTTLVDPAPLQAMQSLLLLSPHVPMVFMGDEWGETQPFLFFAGFGGDLGEAVTRGRRREFQAFGRFAALDVPDPISLSTFEASKLDWAKRDTEEGRASVERITKLLLLRKERIVPLLANASGHSGRVLDAPEHCLAVDWQLDGGTLQARVNLTESAIDLPAASGQIIHLTGKAPGAPASTAIWIDA